VRLPPGPGGKWVGWGLGPPPDDDPKVAEFKAKLRKKFSYAADLDDSTVYDEPLAAVVMEAQRRYGLPVTGLIDYKFQVRVGWVDATPPPPWTARPRGVLFTCQGTVPSTMWDGPPAWTARAVEDLYYFQPVGGPYQAFPMDGSINEEKSELKRQLTRPEFLELDKSLAGYSQGGIVVSEVYFQDILPETGELHYLLPTIKRAVTWGNPSRERGVENGNRYARWKLLGTGSRGIMEDSRRNTGTPDWWLDFGQPKDIYVDTPDDDQGEDYTAICKIIMGSWYGGPDSILSQIIELVQRPLPEALAMMKAIIGAGMFFGGGIKPHVTYPIDPAIQFLRS
jgi:Putative peptidoglycan binding domain